MSIEEKISSAAMVKWIEAKTPEEEAAAGEWANNQLALVSLWNRTGVKPTELEF
tara:strand:+ start:259 stop:420 length:162 start_codon:yes stop_codon:yes gene_type:complete